MNAMKLLREEHRVINNTLTVFQSEVEKIKGMRRIDPVAIEMSIDFIRTYADLAHHGKEENIVFRELRKKSISKEHLEMMNELVEEHQYSRSIVGRWILATERYFAGVDTIQEIIGCLQELITFYPGHILKEDKHFFTPAAQYFLQEEHKKIIQEFEAYDEKILHWKYRKVESTLEESLAGTRIFMCSDADIPGYSSRLDYGQRSAE
ncbi:MAG: cation-binding protein [Deltaproteobacteria bacterium HGW-Deltaproteobacteria-6]|jgi:hemerythrin-like domain-containing protein|nr:MAG: cation-binding protein [Deltaproteobacteria bacterium HGW-Deltaproteobacteria-6]